MTNEINRSGSGRGGYRKGAGRKPGTKISNNDTTFYARCTEKEKELLTEFLNELRTNKKNTLNNAEGWN